MSDKILLVFGVGNIIYATTVQFTEGVIQMRRGMQKKVSIKFSNKKYFIDIIISDKL